MRKAYVLFGESGCWWLQWLKPGFRHAVIAIEHGESVIIIDSLSVGLHVQVLDLAYFKHQLIWMRAGGWRYLYVAVPDEHTRLHVPSIFTCVETVKRVLGIRAWYVLTPYQLYKHITRRMPCALNNT